MSPFVALCVSIAVPLIAFIVALYFIVHDRLHPLPGADPEPSRPCPHRFIDYRTEQIMDHCRLEAGHTGMHRPHRPDSPGIREVE